MTSSGFNNNTCTFLSVEWNLTRLNGPAHGIVTKTVHKTLPGSLFCLPRTGPSGVISSQISSRFTGKVGSCLLCIPPLAFWCQLFRILGQNEVSYDEGFGHVDRQVAIALDA